MKRYFIIPLTLCVFILMGCQYQKKETISTNQIKQVKKDSFFKLSLAQWSLHRTFNDEGVDPFKFAEIAKQNGFEGVEYVNHLYNDEIKMLGFEKVIDSLLEISRKNEINNVLIMIDNEGDLADPDVNVRNQAVENHKKWVDAAAKLGCHSIRVNTFGTNDEDLWVPSVVDGLKKLSEYAAKKNINVLCENHGWLSSNVPILMDAINKVDMENCGTLPDFGNWCVKRKNGENWGECIEEYKDKYGGIKLMLTKAKAVSAKAYDFDDNGDETTLDFYKIMNMVKASGYIGYIGVEYEGERLSELEGITAIKDLLLKSANKLN